MPAARDPVIHLELHTGDLVCAQDIYARLCGWQPQRVESRHGAYTLMEMGTELGGGIVECATPRAVWLPYVEVADVVAATAKAAELGARVLLQPRAGPHGRRSVVATDAGGELAFWQRRR